MLDWLAELHAGIASVPEAAAQLAAETIACSRLVLTAGNGGSSAIASHAAQAIAKPRYAAGGGRASLCLSDNLATLTAHANDGGWQDALAECARPFFEQVEGTLLLVISSSGRSSNLVKLVELAQVHKRPVITFTGRAGGGNGDPLRSLATVSLHVDSDDYEIIEPAHDALLHRLQYNLREITSCDP